MRRRRKPKEELTIELDSFLDILTNSIGIIIVITVMAVLNSSHMTFIFRTPFARATEKAPLFFECADQRVTFVDKGALDRQLDEYRKMTVQRGLNDRELRELVRSGAYKIESPHYRLDLDKFNNENLMLLEPKAVLRGETVQQIEQDDSDYKKLIFSIDPEKRFVFFLVRPDGYKVFRKARKMLWDLQVQAGWEPLKEGRKITFGAKGRKAVID